MFDAAPKRQEKALRAAAQPLLALLRDSLTHARVYAMEPKNTRAKSLAVVRQFNAVVVK